MEPVCGLDDWLPTSQAGAPATLQEEAQHPGCLAAAAGTRQGTSGVTVLQVSPRCLAIIGGKYPVEAVGLIESTDSTG